MRVIQFLIIFVVFILFRELCMLILVCSRSRLCCKAAPWACSQNPVTSVYSQHARSNSSTFLYRIPDYNRQLPQDGWPAPGLWGQVRIGLFRQYTIHIDRSRLWINCNLSEYLPFINTDSKIFGILTLPHSWPAFLDLLQLMN